eukprot:CAMPEP_0168608224 /NCGR_PEP_ID=MMETSP0449_2-20121227/509_1 /TAXON_ID=1082188 /ORGANISM="Strombidium rassoulzadegani, Strain ras09" /LENGTH=210 /DNA_ID=CAMNT_0008648187 /DNA_START=118 /DNA_END=754 /DNA_ORIENTATION=+
MPQENVLAALCEAAQEPGRVQWSEKREGAASEKAENGGDDLGVLKKDMGFLQEGIMISNTAKKQSLALTNPQHLASSVNTLQAASQNQQNKTKKLKYFLRKHRAISLRQTPNPLLFQQSRLNKTRLGNLSAHPPKKNQSLGKGGQDDSQVFWTVELVFLSTEGGESLETRVLLNDIGEAQKLDTFLNQKFLKEREGLGEQFLSFITGVTQ